MVTYVQSYRVATEPLLAWAIIAIVCAAVLVVTAVALSRSSRRAARWLLVASLLGALLDGVLAWRSWVAFLYYTPIGGCRWAPPGVCERFYAEAANAIATATVLGAIAVLGTAALGLSGFLVRRRSTRASSAL